jgi:hypothetical protein
VFQEIGATFIAFDGGGEAFDYAKQFVNAGVGFGGESLQTALCMHLLLILGTCGGPLPLLIH